jgi:hypothetical protein
MAAGGRVRQELRWIDWEEETMKASSFALVALCCLLSSVAFAQDVTYNFMPGTNFSKYHTYKWVMIEGGAHPNRIVDAQIKQSVDSRLAARSFTKTHSDNTDLLVGYQIAVDQEKQWNGYGMGGGLRWGGMATATSSTINVGTMVLGFYAPAAKQLVWTGRQRKHSTQAKARRRTRKIWTRRWQNCSKIFRPQGNKNGK